MCHSICLIGFVPKTWLVTEYYNISQKVFRFTHLPPSEMWRHQKLSGSLSSIRPLMTHRVAVTWDTSYSCFSVAVLCERKVLTQITTIPIGDEYWGLEWVAAFVKRRESFEQAPLKSTAQPTDLSLAHGTRQCTLCLSLPRWTNGSRRKDRKEACDADKSP